MGLASSNAEGKLSALGTMALRQQGAGQVFCPAVHAAQWGGGLGSEEVTLDCGHFPTWWLGESEAPLAAEGDLSLVSFGASLN